MRRLPSFSSRVVSWQLRHGRHDLPWQDPRTPYRVWVSEIMLQQTQVHTAVGYFQAFMVRFPDLETLAHASEDDVLSAWSGLGYYSRARNLHRCAQQLINQWGGQFPKTAQGLQTLPGIGPSTAAAIASLCMGERAAIMDGNVQRVLSRWLAFGQDLAQTSARQALEQLAEQLLPKTAKAMPAYTQGLMDLGATVCKPKQANCQACPVQADCQAHSLERQTAFPVKSRRLKRKSDTWWMLHLHAQTGEVAMVQRPAQGVWARLWSLPMMNSEQQALAVLPMHLQSQVQWAAPIKHVLTHRDWWLNVGHLSVGHPIPLPGVEWMDLELVHQLGLPQPVRRVLTPSLPHAK